MTAYAVQSMRCNPVNSTFIFRWAQNCAKVVEDLMHIIAGNGSTCGQFQSYTKRSYA